MEVELATRTAEVLGGFAVLHRTVKYWGELHRLVLEGLPKQSLQRLASRVVEPGDSVNDFVYSVVPSATFKRRDRLSMDESERTERLARIVALVDRLFDNEIQARRWLNRSHWLFDDETPLEMARTELGARRVEDLIDSIMNGLPL